MSRKKGEYVKTTIYNHPKIWNEFIKAVEKTNSINEKELINKRTASEVLRHLQLMYINFGEDLFKITKI